MLLTSGSDDGDIGGGCSGAHGWTLRGAIWTGLGLGAIHRRVDRAVQPRPGGEGLINPSPCLGIRLSALGCHLAPLIPIKEKDHDQKEKRNAELDRSKKEALCVRLRLCAAKTGLRVARFCLDVVPREPFNFIWAFLELD
jgi:hypothetical protein